MLHRNMIDELQLWIILQCNIQKNKYAHGTNLHLSKTHTHSHMHTPIKTLRVGICIESNKYQQMVRPRWARVCVTQKWSAVVVVAVAAFGNGVVLRIYRPTTHALHGHVRINLRICPWTAPEREREGVRDRKSERALCTLSTCRCLTNSPQRRPTRKAPPNKCHSQQHAHARTRKFMDCWRD